MSKKNSTAEKFFTYVDGFTSGVNGYRRLHADEVGDEKKIWNKDPMVLESTIMEFVSKTNNEAYIKSMASFLKKLKFVIQEFAPKMARFKALLQQLENRFKSLEQVESFEKEFVEAQDKVKNYQQFFSNKQGSKIPNNIKELMLEPMDKLAKKKATDKSFLTGMKNALNNDASKVDAWKKAWDEVKDAIPKAKNEGDKQAAQKASDTFDDNAKKALDKIGEILKQYKTALENQVQDVPDSVKGKEADGKNISADVSIKSYMKWYNADKLDDAEKVDEKAAQMVDVATVSRLYKPGEDPYQGFSAFLKQSQSDFLEFENAVGGTSGSGAKNTTKEIPVDDVQKLLSAITKLEGFVGQLATEDITADSQNSKNIINQLVGLVRQGEQIREKQGKYVHAVGGVPVHAQVNDNSRQHLENLAKDKSPSSSSGGPSAPKSTASALLSSSANAKYSDERRKLDAALAQDAPRLLSRTTNVASARMYLDQLERFKTKISESTPLDKLGNSVLKPTDQSMGHANQDIDQLMSNQGSASNEDKRDENQFQIKEIGKKKKSMMMGMFSKMEDLFDEYANMHSDFILHQHRDGFKYMHYWRNISVDDETFKKLVNEYFSTLDDVIKMVDKHTSAAREEYMSALQGQAKDKYPNLAEWGKGMASDDYKKVMDKFSEVNDRLEEVRNDIMLLYEGHGRRLLQIILAVPFLLMYAVKLIRVIFVWAALHFAEHVFQLWYAKRTYGENADPPNPVSMIGLFVLIDMTMNLTLLAVLYLLDVMFSTSTGNFPINDGFLKAYAVDYVCTTVAVFVLGAVVAQVVKTKKYFRYRYEGERGIRALSSMVFYIALVILMMPFFRVVHI